MDHNNYKYTLQYDWFGEAGEEDCTIKKDVFSPYGEVTEGLKLRGEFGFMKITKVFDVPSLKYGKFIATSITYEEMKQDF